MKYEPSELGRLAKRLETAAGVSRAKAKQHRLVGEKAEADRQERRAEEAAHFSAVCCHFEALFALKNKRAGFQAPTLAEVLDFVRGDELLHRWPDMEVQQWYDHFNSNGWKVSGKAVMVDWKAAARNGARRWLVAHASGAKRQERVNPPGWLEFLATLQSPPRDSSYQYAPGWMKSEFVLWRNARPR